ncbi:MAG: glycerol-3-phosphate dehydrogenase/oxidase [Myxococcota bacterium]
MNNARLGPAHRRTSLRRMSEEVFDVVIVGGGVTGCGVALDAAARGLSVALVEQRDWASGTSSRSSKLIHGGLRYLEQRDFGLVREALREQTLMLTRLCPHLVRPVPFLLPLTHRVWERVYMGAGLLLYDLLAGRRALPRHRHLLRGGALARFPALRRGAITGAIEYHDAQLDDARHTLFLARTAALHGAALASSARAVGFLTTGDRITGVRARCLESGQQIEVRGRRVINATGVWTDEVQHMAGRGRIQVRASKGIHLVVPRDRIHGDSGLVLRTASSVLFVIPWKAHWIIGTTDTEWNLDFAHPAASRADVEYLLETLNAVLKQPLRLEDIEGVYAGLRPLLYGESDATSELSRRHAVSESVSGLITVAGGKYTTYRVMAVDAIDLAVRGIEKRVPPSCTHDLPLLGAEGFQAFWNRRAQIARDSGLHVTRVEHLLSRYGTLIQELLELIEKRPDLAAPLDGAPTYLAAEAQYAASHEGALHLDDMLTRRTRISIETFDRGLAAAQAVAPLMGEVLGWDEATRAREIHHYEARVAAERESQQQPDDRTADAARLGAPDVRMGGMGGTSEEDERDGGAAESGSAQVVSLPRRGKRNAD